MDPSGRIIGVRPGIDARCSVHHCLVGNNTGKLPVAMHWMADPSFMQCRALFLQVVRSAAHLEEVTSWPQLASLTRQRGRGGRGKAGQEYSPVAMSGPLVTILIEDFHTDRIISAETVPH